MAVLLQDNKILLSDGKVAIDEACCCVGFMSVEGTLSGHWGICGAPEGCSAMNLSATGAGDLVSIASFPVEASSGTSNNMLFDGLPYPPDCTCGVTNETTLRGWEYRARLDYNGSTFELEVWAKSYIPVGFPLLCGQTFNAGDGAYSHLTDLGADPAGDWVFSYDDPENSNPIWDGCTAPTLHHEIIVHIN
jgi:hypothetical protein